MHAVRIDEWVTQYRLPASALDQRRRLDRVLELVLDSFLESALERAGVSPDDEICIREIRVPLRLRLSAGDYALALAWAAALANSVRRAIDRGDTERVVRYQSRSGALVDFAQSVALGDLRRAWAWRQMEFGPLHERCAVAAAECLVAALQRQPEQIVPTFCAAAAGGWLDLLASRLDHDQWRLLAHAAVGRSLGQRNLAGLISRERFDGLPREAARAAVVQRSLNSSVIAAAAAAHLQPQLPLEAVRLALATFALLEVEPGVSRRPAEDVRELVAAIATRLGELADRSTPAPPREADRPANRASAAGLAESFGDDAGWSTRAGTTAGKARHRGACAHRTLAEVPPAKAPDERLVPALRTEGATPVGGLLFWICVVDELNLPEELECEEPFCRRPFRWVLHRLALTLAAIDPRDAAALAFAGLGPTAQLPSPDEGPLTDAERLGLSSLRARLVEHARHRLAAANPAVAEPFQTMSDERLFDWICRRPARVVADPGWIVLHFSLDDVSTEIRRAGLDLDPGYVPWLGVVLKYVYE